MKATYKYLKRTYQATKQIKANWLKVYVNGKRSLKAELRNNLDNIGAALHEYNV